MTPLTQANVCARRRARRLAETAEIRARARTPMSDGVERYSAQVADALGLDLMRWCGRVAYALKSLELEGALISRLDEAPRSGLGRRYYRASTRNRDVGARHA